MWARTHWQYFQLSVLCVSHLVCLLRIMCESCKQNAQSTPTLYEVITIYLFLPTLSLLVITEKVVLPKLIRVVCEAQGVTTVPQRCNNELVHPCWFPRPVSQFKAAPLHLLPPFTVLLWNLEKPGLISCLLFLPLLWFFYRLLGPGLTGLPYLLELQSWWL